MHSGACKQDGALLTLGTPWHGDRGVRSPGAISEVCPCMSGGIFLLISFISEDACWLHKNLIS